MRRRVVACAPPPHSALGPEAIARADFSEGYRAPLRRTDLGVVDIFHAIFAHRPAWMNAALIARNRAVSVFGLDTPTDADILHVEQTARVRVGGKIGPWPVFFIGDDELIAGRDNTHMDFRLSILRTEDDVVVSTLCRVKNAFGRGYLTTIIPFHKLGLRLLITNAIAAGRL